MAQCKHLHVVTKALMFHSKHKSHVQGTVCYICIKISGTAKVTNSVFAKEFHKHDQSFYKFEKYFNESLRLFCIKPLHSAPWFSSVKHHKFSWHHQATCWCSAWRRWDCLQLHSPLQVFSSSQLPVQKHKMTLLHQFYWTEKNPYLNKSEMNYSIL